MKFLIDFWFVKNRKSNLRRNKIAKQKAFAFFPLHLRYWLKIDRSQLTGKTFWESLITLWTGKLLPNSRLPNTIYPPLSLIYIHTHTHAHTHTYTHSHTHTHIHSHSHIHTHIHFCFLHLPVQSEYWSEKLFTSWCQKLKRIFEASGSENN